QHQRGRGCLLRPADAGAGAHRGVLPHRQPAGLSGEIPVPLPLTPTPIGGEGEEGKPPPVASAGKTNPGSIFTSYRLLLLLPWSPPWRPIVEAWASVGREATDRSIAIAGGVTAANLPHLLKNSRRSSSEAGETGICKLLSPRHQELQWRESREIAM